MPPSARMSASGPPIWARIMTEGKPLLCVWDLHAWHDESHILPGVDLTVCEGETMTLLGRNGSCARHRPGSRAPCAVSGFPYEDPVPRLFASASNLPQGVPRGIPCKLSSPLVNPACRQKNKEHLPLDYNHRE